MGERIAVIGASGYTGRLVVQELSRRGVEAVAVGRNHPTPLVDALDGCGAVINCIGSFVEHGDAVVSAAIAAGVPYVDTSAEFPFLRRVFEVHDSPAREAGVPLLPGMAFYSAPADFAAAIASEALESRPDTVEIAYRLTGARPSRGTLRTNLRRIGEPCFVRDGGQLVARRIGDDVHPFSFPNAGHTATVARWPGGEVLTVPRHTGAPSVGVFLGMPKPAAAVLRNRGLCAALQRAGGVLLRPGTGGPSDDARTQARFIIVVEAKAARTGARCIITGHDLYGLTAFVCVAAAQRLANALDVPCGALAPAEVFAPGEFLDSLSDHLSWCIET